MQTLFTLQESVGRLSFFIVIDKLFDTTSIHIFRKGYRIIGNSNRGKQY